MQTIEVAVSASWEYSRYISVLLYSLCRSNPASIISLNVFYVDSRVERQKPRLLKMVQSNSFSATVAFTKVPQETLSGVADLDGWSVDLWARWFLLDSMAHTHDRVLVLGLDTFVRGDISPYYNQEMGDNLFAATPDMWINSHDPETYPAILADMQEYGMESSSKYINGDVVLVNLAAARGRLSFDEFLNFQVDHQFTCWDQDVINYIFGDSTILASNYGHNYFPNFELPADLESYGNVDDAIVVQFAGGPKPWNVAPWRAKQFDMIPDWWRVARTIGVFNLVDILRMALLEVRDTWLRR